MSYETKEVKVLNNRAGQAITGLHFHPTPDKFSLRVDDKLDDLSIGDKRTREVVARVCQTCRLFEQCQPELSRPKGFFRFKPFTFTGAMVSYESCRLRYSVIPDWEFALGK